MNEDNVNLEHEFCLNEIFNYSIVCTTLKISVKMIYANIYFLSVFRLIETNVTNLLL